MVGQPVSLPCFYPELLTFGNFAIEWRRDDKVVLRSEWEEDGYLEVRSTDRATISADATLTGNLSLELPTVDPTEDKTYYSLFIVSGKDRSAPLCTVCLRVAGQCEHMGSNPREYFWTLTPVFDGCSQPVSAPHCCRRQRQSREMRRPSGVTPAGAFLNLQFTGSSTTPRNPPKVQ